MWFKKKPAPTVDVPVKWRVEKFNVGITAVTVKLVDGRSFDTLIKGYVEQYTGSQNSINEGFKIPAPFVRSSAEEAVRFLRELSQTSAFYDDRNEPSRAYVGQPASATIMDTWRHEVPFDVAYLEE